MSGHAVNNDVKGALERSFRQLVLERRYRSVSIGDICKEAHVSRNTFYDYFQNKEDLLATVFRNDAFRAIEQFHTMFSCDELRDIKQVEYTLVSKMYSGLLNEKELYSRLVLSMHGNDNSFIRAVTKVIYEFDRQHLKKIGYRGSERRADYVAYFFASSQAMIMEKWILDGFAMSASELATLYNNLTYSFWLEHFGASSGRAQ
ncbi:TetR/AcrR family transcriptional regulator [Xiamenia xianingshaonis]|uniref:TetR family transcriptional regulator n=1 Tax=Xiamenia xianingshaonis TaxID=2682776 RepID=A0ABX0IIU4_9ACTN|nr:TetR/AcrR family transcriptional regulator [Xiamenia xianingshaonis]NGM17469.1 TetR family transcriptional regulator [Eggerthellaceae bacterium zg-893]NHM14767.1 TetR family transcriptional regulator [Xiamenia xianingshaonis]NHM16791.1 TetR family transcriptional regulator [Xiamenia xianingshaonis]